MQTTLSLNALRAANVKRQEFYPKYSWSLDVWLIALAGELGEAMNLVKKLIRDRDGLPGNSQSRPQLVSDLADEIADVAIYLDLLMWAAERSFYPGLRYDAGTQSIAVIADAALADAPPGFSFIEISRDLVRGLGDVADAVFFEDRDELQECGDALLAELFALARALGVDFGAAIIRKFNASSEKLGYAGRLSG